MPQPRYLADTSVFARLTKPEIVAAFAPLAAQGSVALCAPVAFELGYSARSHADHAALTDRLLAFPAVPAPTQTIDGRWRFRLHSRPEDNTEHYPSSMPS